MRFNKSHVKEVLHQFDAGLSPHEILHDLQSRDYLPSVTVATIEQCIRDNGRVLPTHEQIGHMHATGQENQPVELDHEGSPPDIPPASQSAPAGPSKKIVRFTPETSFAESNKPARLANNPTRNNLSVSRPGIFIARKTTVLTTSTVEEPEHLDDDESTAGPPVLWDYETEKYVLDGYNANKSRAEIWRSLRDLGYDITLHEIMDSMVRQGLPIDEGPKGKGKGREEN